MNQGGLDGLQNQLSTFFSETTTSNTPKCLSLSDKESVIVSLVFT